MANKTLLEIIATSRVYIFFNTEYSLVGSVQNTHWFHLNHLLCKSRGKLKIVNERVFSVPDKRCKLQRKQPYINIGYTPGNV